MRSAPRSTTSQSTSALVLTVCGIVASLVTVRCLASTCLASICLVSICLASPSIAAAAEPTGSAFEADARKIVGARGLGMAAHRGVVTGNEAIFLNPAGMAISRRYTVQADYSNVGPSAVRGSGHALNASIVDSISNPELPTGVAYRHLWLGEGDDRIEGSVGDLAFAFLLNEHLALGTRLSYFAYRRGDGKETLHQVTGDVGAMLIFQPFTLGLVGYNLLGFDTPDGPRAYAAGMALGTDRDWRVALDYRLDHFDDRLTHSFALGGEYLLGDAMPVRLGYTWDRTREQGYWSTGLGLVTQRFGMDLAFRWAPGSGERLFAIAFKIFQ